ncbi:MAG: hypothetical protein BGN96_11570 [Bacteroidales bacterium 45-6]|nr:MAG: hypothetical protein BGN96_11570 [Bacteroidales bacterium 45-6]
MRRKDGVFNKLVNLTKEHKNHLHILEETIPVSEQFEYFNFSKKLRENETPYIDRNYLISLLFTPELSIEEKRKYLSLLAGIADVAAYRAIETYHSSPLEPELANWSAMALVESRILLNTDLTGEQQIFVSTGLGGHSGKLRYFFVVASKGNRPFTSLQSEIIEREFRFQFNLTGIEIEKEEKEAYYFTYLVLADLAIDIKELVDATIRECNEYGHFIHPESMITNTKILSKEDIEKHLAPNGSTSGSAQSIEI